ncbi:hypothetical protein RCO48_15615 [Peribacillus frigoritolerans]|nr:hypothetical protein [Peribacillus frigoritolerans]
MERKVRDSCGKSVAKGDPAGDAEGGPPEESECLKWKSNPPPNYISWFRVRPFRATFLYKRVSSEFFYTS